MLIQNKYKVVLCVLCLNIGLAGCGDKLKQRSLPEKSVKLFRDVRDAPNETLLIGHSNKAIAKVMDRGDRDGEVVTVESFNPDGSLSSRRITASTMRLVSTVIVPSDSRYKEYLAQAENPTKP
jgi:hypothetical protein